MSNDKQVRVSFMVPAELHVRMEHIPKGIRSSVLRELIEKVVTAGESSGTAVYGAFLDGSFDLVPRFKQ